MKKLRIVTDIYSTVNHRCGSGAKADVIIFIVWSNLYFNKILLVMK